MGVLGVRINGAELSPSIASISVSDEGLLRGDGVFEVIRLYAGAPFGVQAHIDRMVKSAAGLRLPFDPVAAANDVTALCVAAQGRDGLIRLVQTRGGSRIALLEDLPRLPQSVRLRTVICSPTGLLDGIKTISYAANALATRLAIEEGADDALLVGPGGNLREGPNFAVFVAFTGSSSLCTPPLYEGILDSITRRCVMELVTVEERPIASDELPSLSEAFVVSTIREILPVRQINDVKLTAPSGPLTGKIKTLFGEDVRAATRSQSREQQLQPR